MPKALGPVNLSSIISGLFGLLKHRFWNKVFPGLLASITVKLIAMYEPLFIFNKDLKFFAGTSNVSIPKF